MKNFKKYLSTQVQIAVVVLVLFTAVYVSAQSWQDNSTAPPGNNATAPLNVSGSGQTKAGGLTVASAPPSGGIGFVVANGKVGLGLTGPQYAVDISGEAGANGAGLRVIQGSFLVQNYNNQLTGTLAQINGNTVIGGNVTANAYFYSSDKSLKTNIAPLFDSLAKVLKLQGVSFNWKDSGKPSLGVVAQDVEKVYPELVATDPKTGLKSVEYGNLVAPLIEAVKAQQVEIDQLKARIEKLEANK